MLPQSERQAAIAQAAPDVASHMPLRFDPAFDNPCWRNGTRLRCLPAFYIVGGMQCGVADLWGRLRAHKHVLHEHDAAPHWWSNHPRSRAGDFARYINLFSGRRTVERIEQKRRSLVGDASPASFAFILAEQLRMHYLYLDAFSSCHRRCRGRSPPAEHAASCRQRSYDLSHCYAEARRNTVRIDFNLPSFVATVMADRPPAVVALLREPMLRLWIAFHTYGQYAAKYGPSDAGGFGYYFGNQSLAFAACAAAHGRLPCVLRFESLGAAEAGVYYHADQLLKGAYAAFMPEWQQAIPPSRLLVMRTEDYIAAPGKALRRVAKVVGLRPFTHAELRAATSLPSVDELARQSREHGEPPPAEAAAVRRWYRPFNQALAAQLGSDDFLWRA